MPVMRNHILIFRRKYKSKVTYAIPEWARFGKEVLSYATRLGDTPSLAEDARKVLFICGEGESLAATHLAADGWRVLSAESDAPHALLAALKRGNDAKAVVCGTMTAKQRHPWLRATQEVHSREFRDKLHMHLLVTSRICICFPMGANVWSQLGVLNVSFVSFASSDKLPSKRDGFTVMYATHTYIYIHIMRTRSNISQFSVAKAVPNKQPEATTPTSDNADAHP